MSERQQSPGSSGLAACETKMRAAGVHEVAIATFRHHYLQLERGASGLLSESELEPVVDLPTRDELPDDPAGARTALEQAVVIRLNGGLGTSMGMTRAKSLLPVKDGLTFLDVIVRQVLALRHRSGARVPLVLMNSFATRDDTLTALAAHPEIESDVPLDFLQHREPKLQADTLEPVRWPADPGLEWCPPGHGDLYDALVSSGLLRALLDRGYRYAFVANADNLGATLDERILAWIAAERVPFLMEVARRTEADRKGGHLARRVRDGQLVLREVAQTPDEDLSAFEDVDRHRYFNTNSVWVDLVALRATLDERDGVLDLPLIVNRKTVDPADRDSPAVLQIETAMGAAISVFPGARALCVPRERFAPVKTTNDLLALRSDCYVLTDDAQVVADPRRTFGPLVADLDPAHYKLIADFDMRFPAGPPSLVDCSRIVVRGDVRFGAGVVARDAVSIEHPGPGQLEIPDGAILSA